MILENKDVLKAVEAFKGSGNPIDTLDVIKFYIDLLVYIQKKLAQTEEEATKIEKQKNALYAELDRQLEVMNVPQIIKVKCY